MRSDSLAVLGGEMSREQAIALLTETIRASEMRQGCTNHSYYAELTLKQLESQGYRLIPELKVLEDEEKFTCSLVSQYPYF